MPHDAEVTDHAADEKLWRERVRKAVDVAGTPALIFSRDVLGSRVGRLKEAFEGGNVRHWWSFKTLPLLPAIRAWRRLGGGGVEVVSEFELQAVLGEGVPPSDVLVNGPVKHTWLPRHPVPGLRVNIDSLSELRTLAPMAARLGWSVGLRFNTSSELNFEYPGVRTQFGLLAQEVPVALAALRRAKVSADVLHFHLRTNVPEARCYHEAAMEALAVAEAAGWTPRVLDVGGGFPPERVKTRKGAPLNAGFSLGSLREGLSVVRRRHRYVEEIWMENGRWLTASMGVLAVRVLDVKEGRGMRTLICDGGRTLHAMVATWERHGMFAMNPRRGAAVRTLVCGPTCMAFDNLGIQELPSTIRTGDVLIWRDAGAYQMSWETRFSHGLGAIVWTGGEGAEAVVVRERESFGQWRSGR